MSSGSSITISNLQAEFTEPTHKKVQRTAAPGYAVAILVILMLFILVLLEVSSYGVSARTITDSAALAPRDTRFEPQTAL